MTTWLSVLGFCWLLIGLLTIACVVWKGWPLLLLGDIAISAFVGLGLCLGIFTVVAAVFFLLRRSWARFALECVSWVNLVGLPVVALYEYRVRQGFLNLHLVTGNSLAEEIEPLNWGRFVWLVFFSVSVAVFRSKATRAVLANGAMKRREA
jgi:hypothetical protein